jgi:hypothetical protein
MLWHMSAIAYTVIATLPDAATRDEYVAWLEDGHLDAVIKGGAHSAMIVVVEEPAAPLRVETRYIFQTRAVFDHYVAQVAPALRADGARRFPPSRGVGMERRVGRVL